MVADNTDLTLMELKEITELAGRLTLPTDDASEFAEQEVPTLTPSVEMFVE